MPKIVDCFTFFNELDVLEVRLAYLYDVVDYFVIVEADCTFSGIPKEHLLKNNMQRFSQYSDKMILHSIQMPTFKNHKGIAWERESYQRNYIATAVKQLQLEASDRIFISDVDEIPDKETTKAIQSGNIHSMLPSFDKKKLLPAFLKHMFKFLFGVLAQRETRYWLLDRKSDYFSRLKICALMFFKGRSSNFFSLRLEIFDYYVNYLETDESDFTEYNRIYFKCISPDWLNVLTPNEIRQSVLLFPPNALPTLTQAGWHFSFLGGIDAILYKLRSYSHQELNTPDIASEEYIHSCITNGQHPLRKFLNPNDTKPSFRKVGMDGFPMELKHILMRYPHLILH